MRIKRSRLKYPFLVFLFLYAFSTATSFLYPMVDTAWATDVNDLNGSAYRFYNQSDTSAPGSTLAGNSTAATLANPGQEFRLRTGVSEDKPLTWKQVSVGKTYTCAIASDNKAYCWGNGNDGKLGNNSTTNARTPVAVHQGEMPAGATFRQISAGDSHTCAIASDNKAYCWGWGGYGQLGNDSTTDSLTPVAVSQGEMPAGATIRQISVGYSHTCAIASDNKAYCWGAGNNGRLGNNSTAMAKTPVAVHQGAMPAGATFRQISVGERYTCAIASDNKAYCWGWGNAGRLGNNSTTDAYTPVAVHQGAMPAGATVQQILTGYAHTCAIASDNKSYCWGSGSNGRLGNNSTASSSTPVAVHQGAMPAGATIRQISVGYDGACAIASDNKAYCWGANYYAQLGNNSTADARTPVAVLQGEMPTGATIQQIYIGGGHTCAIASDNKAYCWGDSFHSQIGNGTSNGNVPLPAAISQGAMPAGVTTVRQISSIYRHTCAIASDNKAYCWGDGGNGRLGYDSAADAATPVATNDIIRGYLDPSISYVLQYAAKAATSCSAQTTGFQTVTNSSALSYAAHASLANGSAISADANDPIASTGGGITHQTLRTAAGSFTAANATPIGNIALWDFSLKTNRQATAETYCLRIAHSDGTPLANYPVFPEVTTTPGLLSLEIVDGAGTTLSGGTFAMQGVTASTSSQNTTGKLGNSSSRLRVSNSLASGGWTLSIAPTNPSTAAWRKSDNSAQYKYNDGTNGNLSINPQTATISPVGTCSANGLIRGASATYSSTVNNIMLVDATASAQIDCNWNIQDIDLTQYIPAGQAAGNYTLELTATVVAK